MGLNSLHDNKFTSATINQFRESLTEVQKDIIDAAWNHYWKTGEHLSVRSLPAITGRTKIDDALDGIFGIVIFKGENAGNTIYYLNLHGALLSKNGPQLSTLIIKLIDFIKEIFNKHPHTTQIDSRDIRSLASLDKTELRALCLLLKLYGIPKLCFSLAGWSPPYEEWSIRISDEVVDLVYANDASSYFDELLAARFIEILDNDPLRDVFGTDYSSDDFFTPKQTKSDTLSMTQSFVSAECIDILRSTDNPNFDCTRLVCILEELNTSFINKNVHAVSFLIRAVIDHIPPIFSYDTFEEVVAHYQGGGRSFKKSADRLQKHTRSVADKYLHMPIRKHESLPDLLEVSWSQELASILTETCRLLKNKNYSASS
jgi:hypothetical protein